MRDFLFSWAENVPASDAKTNLSLQKTIAVKFSNFDQRAAENGENIVYVYRQELISERVSTSVLQNEI